MGHAGHHASDLGAIGKGVRLADAAEAEGAERAALLGLRADGRTGLGDGDRAFVRLARGHHATSSGTWGCGPRSLSPVGGEHALGHEVLGVEAPQAGDLVGPLERLEAVDRGAGDVDVVGAAERLAEHVVHAGLLEDGAGGATGDHAGAGRGRLEQHAAGAHAADDRVGDGGAGEGHLEEVLARLLGALLDGEGHLLGLAVAETDAAVAVADHHEGGEAEATTALHDLGDAVDVDDARLAQRRIAGRARVLARLALALATGGT